MNTVQLINELWCDTQLNLVTISMEFFKISVYSFFQTKNAAEILISKCI